MFNLIYRLALAMLPAALVVGFLAPISPASALSSIEDTDINFLAVHGPAALTSTQISTSDKQMVSSYLDDQLRINQITMDTFKALTPSQQRIVLTPGKHLYISREARRAIMPKRNSVPYNVREQLVTNASIDDKTLTRYAVTIPETVAMSMSALPEGHARVLIGDSLVIIDESRTIKDVSSIK
ncbi:MAG: hypothetical protein VKJ06_08690 [Vampirovibrionales bacterium]|nr:hypothetical protein [Vampirovibrionales bacterium]